MEELREGYVTNDTPFELTAHGDVTAVPVAFVADGLSLAVDDRVLFKITNSRAVVVCRLVGP